MKRNKQCFPRTQNTKRHPNDKIGKGYIYICNSQKRYTNNYKEGETAPKIKQMYIKTMKNHIWSI